MTTATQGASIAERALAFRSAMRETLGSVEAADQYAGDILNAARHYITERKVGLKTKTREKSLNKIIQLCDSLSAEIAVNREWLSFSLDRELFDGTDVEAIIEGESHSTLLKLKIALVDAIEKESGFTGREAIYYRRRFWTWLTMIYEDAAERRAATSKDKDGIVSGNFVKYIRAASALIKGFGEVTPDMVDQFIDWYRGADAACDREEIVEHRFTWLAVHPAGPG